MEWIKAIALGVIQGLSEFLPISSSGHLVIFSELFQFADKGLAFDVFVHFGTLLAVVLVFYRDIWMMIRTLPGLPAFVWRGMSVENAAQQYQAMTLFILIGSVPAAVIGLLFEKQIERIFHNHYLALGMLLLTAIILWSSRYTRERQTFLNGKQAFLIGLAQAFAIIPGVSRSGSTIVTGLWLGMDRNLAARFSFLLSVPVIFGATILKLTDLMDAPPPSSQIINLAAGTMAAALSGYLAIIWLLDVIRKKKLEWFALYCAAVSVLGFLGFLLV